MKWHIAMAAAMLMGGAGWAGAQVSPVPERRFVPPSRVQAALEDMRTKETANPTTQPAGEETSPQAMRDELIRLRAQVSAMKKENTSLRDQLQQANNERYDMQQKVDRAMLMAERAYWMAQRSYAMPTYAGWTDSWAYPGGPVFTIPAQGAVGPTILPPIPGNGLDPRFLPRNFALPSPAPAAAPTRGR